jgi:hypothetical protein
MYKRRPTAQDWLFIIFCDSLQQSQPAGLTIRQKKLKRPITGLFIYVKCMKSAHVFSAGYHKIVETDDW